MLRINNSESFLPLGEIRINLLKQKGKIAMKTRKNVFFALILAALLTFFAMPVAAADGPAGNWTDYADSTWTVPSGNSAEISTAGQLAQFAKLVNSGNSFSGKTITVTEDIDLSAHYWVPAGDGNNCFSGTFDGGLCKISGMNAAAASGAAGKVYMGFFGCAGSSAKIMNLNLEGSVSASGISGDSSFVYIGGVAGVNQGLIKDCMVAVDVTASGNRDVNIGGITGWNKMLEGFSSNAYVVNCCFTGSVTSENNDSAYVGGIAGLAELSYIYGCMSLGEVYLDNSEKSSIGSITGQDYGNAFTSYGYCFWTGSLNPSGSGGLPADCGRIINGTVKGVPLLTALNNWVDAINDQQHKSIGQVLHWSVISAENKAYPVLSKTGASSDRWSEHADKNWVTPSAGSVVTVTTAAELAAVANDINAGSSYSGITVNLGNDIDLDDYYWVPAGTVDNPFEGTLNGCGYTVSGMKVLGSYEYSGLFGCIGINGFVIDLNLSGTVSTSTYDKSAVLYAGGLAGENKRMIDDCLVSVDVSAGDCGIVHAGGIAGKNSGSIINSAGKSNVSGSSYGQAYAGGIAGINDSSVTNCYALGAVSLQGLDTTSDYSHAGGICGLNNGSVLNCYETGKVSSKGFRYGYYIGGIMGETTGGFVKDYYIADGYTGAYDVEDSDNLMAKTSEEMKAKGKSGTVVSFLNDWVDVNNSGSAYKNWFVTQAVNGGYPAFVSERVYYDVWVNGIQVNNENCFDILEDANTASLSFDPKANKLTVSGTFSGNLTVTGDGTTDVAAGAIDGNLTLSKVKNITVDAETDADGAAVTGAAVISASNNIWMNNTGSGCVVKGDLTLNGPANLTLSSSASSTAAVPQAVGGTFTVNDGGVLVVKNTNAAGAFASAPVYNAAKYGLVYAGEAESSKISKGYLPGFDAYQNKYVEVRAHSHSGPVYSAEDNVILEKCFSADCDYKDTATISISQSTYYYTGSPIEPAVVTYSDGWQGGELTVTYKDNTEPGTATAAITKGGQTAEVTFAIEKQRFDISVEKSANGSVTAGAKTAEEGQLVFLTVTPDKGYTLETLTVTKENGEEVELNEAEDYIFKMPDSAVTVTATFMEDNTMLNYFVDVFARDFYYDAVLWAAENGIANGTDAVHFTPGGICTRAEAVTLLWRVAGSPEVKDGNTFSDVKKGSYYEKAVAWALAEGITKGTSATTFSPDAYCSRGQIVTLMYRMEKLKAINAKENPFIDVAEGTYYYDAVLWAAENGITVGTDENLFSPDKECTRGEIITFIYRLAGNE